MGTKGHWIRPRYVSRETYGKNFDMAFGGKPEEKDPQDPDLHVCPCCSGMGEVLITETCDKCKGRGRVARKKEESSP